MVIQAYEALDDKEGTRRAAQTSLERAEKAIAAEPANGSAMAFGASALVILGMYDHAKEWATQALLVDPDTPQVRLNVACAMIRAGEKDMALDLLEQVLSRGWMVEGRVHWMERDTDLDPIREHPRFKAIIAEAKEQLATQNHASHWICEVDSSGIN